MFDEKIINIKIGGEWFLWFGLAWITVFKLKVWVFALEEGKIRSERGR